MDIRGIVAANLAALLERRGLDGKELAAKSRWPRGKKKGQPVSARAVQYALATTGDKPSPSIDLIEAVAVALKIPAWTLLAPVLDPADMPKMASEKEMEAEVDRRVAILWNGINQQIVESLRAHEDPNRPSAVNAFPHLTLPPTAANAGNQKTDGRHLAKPAPHAGKK